MATFDVITLDREFGAGGSDIARKLGDRLGWKVWDEQLTHEIARVMDCDSAAVEAREEVQDPLYYRMLKAFFRGSAEGVQNAPRLKMVDADCIREVTERVVRAKAERGYAVLVGRGSAYYLRDRPGVFHVFVYAPYADKVRRLQSRGESLEEAEHLAETVDRERAAFIKRYFRREWPDPYLFHLMVNSSIGDDAVVQIIVQSIAGLRS
jgi:cytidylate kinase